MERLWFIANLAEVLIDREDFSLVRMHCPPGNQPPLHVHAAEDEGFYVLSGSLTVWAGDSVAELSPGEFVLGPAGVPHTYRAGAEGGAVVLVTSAPGVFVSFLREATLPMPSRGRRAARCDCRRARDHVARASRDASFGVVAAA